MVGGWGLCMENMCSSGPRVISGEEWSLRMKAGWERDDGAEEAGRRVGSASHVNGSLSTHPKPTAGRVSSSASAKGSWNLVRTKWKSKGGPQSLGEEGSYRLPCMVIVSDEKGLNVIDVAGAVTLSPLVPLQCPPACLLPKTAFFCLEVCSWLPSWKSWNTKESIASGGHPQLMPSRLWWISPHSLASWVGYLWHTCSILSPRVPKVTSSRCPQWYWSDKSPYWLLSFPWLPSSLSYWLFSSPSL